jgi:signal transduction histidine kinase
VETNSSKIEARLAGETGTQARIDTLNEFSWQMLDRDSQRSQALSEEAEYLATSGEFAQVPYHDGLAFSLMVQSILAWDRSDYANALTKALEAVTLFEQSGNLRWQAYTLNHVAGIHFQLGNYPDAIALGFSAIKMAEESEDAGLLASVLNDTGYMRLHVEGFPDPLPQLFRSLELHRETGSRRGEAQALDSIGKAYLLLGEYDKALAYEHQSLDIDRAIGYRRAETEALGNLGRIHAAAGETEQALAYLNESLALAREGGYRQFEAAALIEIGRIYQGRGATDRALEALHDARTVAADIQAKQVLFETYAVLAEVYEQAGDYVQALAHHRQFHGTKEEVVNERVTTRLRSLEVMFEVQKARQEAEIYQLRNVALQQEIQEREKLIAELDAFAHTVAHDLKSPLSVIIGFGEMLRDEVSAPGAVKLVQELLKMGYKTSRIVDELLTLSSVRQEEVTPVPLDMAAVVQDATSRLVGMIESTEAEITMPLHWLQAMGYGPWVEEIWMNYISNAIKYGGTPPRVELGATPEDGQVRFWVRDNGPGLTPAQQRQLFSEFTRLGTTRIQGHGLGLSIVQRIVDKLGGRAGVESAPGQGSTFSFTLPAVEETIQDGPDHEN